MRVTACGAVHTLKLTGVCYAGGIVHNLITYYKLDEKGFMLTYKAGRRVVAANSDGRVAFDIDIRRDVLIAGRTRLRALRALVARQSSIGEEEKEVVDERAPDDALGRSVSRRRCRHAGSTGGDAEDELNT
ncbi:hypothetical protein PI124_g17641 [Phytophthora idaei]|nr:hypothetical protein PI125_g18241 [Phytophthora idaei]KAG3138528.1 hypothetical protein PI126_g16869 [Phytophthora idaei]KAG3237366.1 hypothetical protein PI124_g17641 [Phytophthora idaei]